MYAGRTRAIVDLRAAVEWTGIPRYRVLHTILTKHSNTKLKEYDSVKISWHSNLIVTRPQAISYNADILTKIKHIRRVIVTSKMKAAQSFWIEIVY